MMRSTRGKFGPHHVPAPLLPQSAEERVSAGRGCRGDPPGEARDCTLRRYGRSFPGHLRAMLLEDFQIAN